MAFLAPKPPKVPLPPPAPTPASKPIQARDSNANIDPYQAPSSLISTSPTGLRRKASTQKTTLIGG